MLGPRLYRVTIETRNAAICIRVLMQGDLRDVDEKERC